MPQKPISPINKTYVEAEFAERGGSRDSCQTRTDYYYIQTAFVCRVYKFLMRFIVCPFFRER